MEDLKYEFLCNSENKNSQIEEEENLSNAEIQNHDYINSDMVCCDDNTKHYISEDEYPQNKSEEYSLTHPSEEEENIQFRSNQYHHLQDEYTNFSNNIRKRQPLKVLRKTRIEKLHQNIDLELNFMLLGDIFIHKDVFIDCRDRKISNICPISSYRPVISTEKTDKFCLAFLENSANGLNDIRIPAQLLQQLNFDRAHQVSQSMIQLMHYYESVQTLQQRVNDYYKNNRQRVEQIIRVNHQKSLLLAQQYLKRITQEKIIMFHYKRIDPVTLTHKLHYSGSNITMCELFTGSSDFSVMEQYMNRIGTPRYIDAEGMVNLTLAKFSGQNTFNLNLITLDDLVIPLTCTIKRIFLQEFEIIPGEKMSEYLDIHVLDTNLNVIQDILAKRKQPSQLLAVSQLEYEMKAEIFIQKFYDGNKNSSNANL